jgi:hypothetical protein
MEKLKHSEEIISLGKKLVNEFAAKNDSSITLNWMSHYLSELILSAENESDINKRKDLERECCQMILKVWEARSHYTSRAKPLHNIEHCLKILTALKDSSYTPYWDRFEGNKEEPWVSFASKISEAYNDIILITILASCTSELLDREKEWLKYPNLLTNEEKAVIEKLDNILIGRDYFLNFNYEESSKKKKKGSRKEMLFSKLDELNENILTAFDTLKKHDIKK